jgi:thioredoxin reductase
LCGVDIVRTVQKSRYFWDGINIGFNRKMGCATGVQDHLPKIPGIDELYGRLVHHCPYCDGWEHREKHLVAFADGAAAVELALSLRPWSKQVTSCSNGHSLSAPERKLLADNGIACREERVERMAEREKTRVQIGFHGSASLTCDAVFFGADQGQRSPLPQLLGCEINEEGLVERDAKQRTCIEGVFVAGDAAGDVQFAIAAASEGATAAVAINLLLQEQETR